MIGRRQLLRSFIAAGAAPLGLSGPRPAGAEAPPETTRLRLVRLPATCVAPEYVAEELLRAEGFTDVQYVKVESTLAKGKALLTGQADITSYFAAPFIIHVDAGEPMIALAGMHVGCFELFATERIRAIRDLKGKTIAMHVTMSAEHVFIASILAHVGMDPDRDVRWATYPPSESMKLLAEGKIDAFLCFPPVSQELRARKIGHVLVNSSIDRPWAQYFCCITVGNREFVRRYPVATKRALRALLKATDLCAREPERAARLITERGFVDRYDHALQTLREVPYDRWRQQDPADTIRFYALRLREGGMIKANPQKIIAQGADWRFLNELKKELKG
jgi:NitT/TauT family transport system substrate-binding protein